MVGMYSKRQPPVRLRCPRCRRWFTRLAYFVRNKRRRNKNGLLFCSPRCFHRHRWGGGRSTRIKCFGCRRRVSVQLWQVRRRNGRVFHSKACFNQWRSINLSGANSAAWKGGKSWSYTGSGWKRARAAARARDHDTCRCCLHRWQEGERRFDVHHLREFESFRDPFAANVLDNLVTLCRTCHGKFNPNYRGKRPEIKALSVVLRAIK